MKDYRIKEHPVLPIEEREDIRFYWNNTPMNAKKGEVISSALFANGVKIFGHHPKDGSAQGIFCANGQCAKCTVIANGIPVKSCMTKVTANMIVESVEGLPKLPEIDEKREISDIEEISTDVLIIGGGPAGLSAALQLGKNNIKAILVDDKNKLGGKLVLQTHKFFGSVEDSYAGTRGNQIGEKLAKQVMDQENIDVWLNSTALYVFKDKKVGILKNGIYKLVTPKVVFNAAGAREKFLRFPGNTLAGIYGAGAFQTLVNRDLVKPTNRLFIVGGGNVGLIAGYHALQAGIKVVGLVEALPQCGGYKVHLDKLKRLGVPVYTSHTVVRAEGKEQLERIVVAKCDERFNPIAGTEMAFDVDTLLVAVGLTPINELYDKLVEFGIRAYRAGDSEEISEASAAIFSGKITGRRIARDLGVDVEIPEEWDEIARVLRSKPGKTYELNIPEHDMKVYPIIRCVQEIPCNPCTEVCPSDSIKIPDGSIMGLPVFEGDCIGCMKCVDICPGLAITLLRPEYNKEKGTSLVTLPYELDESLIHKGSTVNTVDMEGKPVGIGKVISIKKSPSKDKRRLVSIEVPSNEAKLVAGFVVQEEEKGESTEEISEYISDDTIICRCERVTAGEIRAEIRAGVRDMNILKATIRTGMGACGGKTCTELILRLFQEEGVDLKEVTLPTNRPFVTEIPLGAFAGINRDEEGTS